MPSSSRTIAFRRGYMAIGIRDRGSVPRNFKKAFNASSKEAWHDVGLEFHTENRHDRFTPEHARKAGYAKRKRSYYLRKLKDPRLGGGAGQADPLTYTGDAKKRAKRASITETSKGTRIRYPGLSKFNYRHPRSTIRMNDEFRRLTSDEITDLAAHYDARLDLKLELQDKG